MLKFRWFVYGLALWLSLPAGAQQSGIPDAAELEIALQKLNVLGSVLYVGAHPDDENSSVLAYLSKGRKYRSAYLSVTRGEGGQNLIGAEKGAEIGLLRTQELMSARRIDGAEQFFTRAVDFGYSKTAEESFAFWGREKILGDIVWIIRKFRPDVIITRFTPESSGGHGHHTAAAILTRDAFAAASDPNQFPEQLKYHSPWQAKRLLWNSGRPSPDEAKIQIRVDTGEYDPLLGTSYSEIAGQSRSQHKSQGFGSAGRRGSQVDTFVLMAGEPATRDLFDGIDTTWNRVPGGNGVGVLLADCIKSFDPRQPSKSIPGLLGVHAVLAKLPDEAWVRKKKDELTRVIQACAGLWMEAMADDFAAAPGDKVRIRTTIVNRSGQTFTLHSLTVPPLASDSVPDRALEYNVPGIIDTPIQIPKDFPLSEPYWLEPFSAGERFSESEYDLLGSAENPPSLAVKIGLNVAGHVLEYSVPVLFRWSDPVEGERFRPFEIRPPVTIHIENRVVVFAGDRPKTVKIRLKSHSQNLAGLLRIKGPDGWKIAPAGVPFSLAGKYEECDVTFEVAPPKNSGEADLRAEAEIGGATLSRDMVSISYPHIHPQVYFPESRFRVVRLDVKTEGKRIGYIMGAGDEVPEALQNLGYDVTLVTDEMLEKADLSPFEALIAGIRAYNTRERLKPAKGRLLQFIERGGTLIVQYNVPSAQLADLIGPYLLTIGRDRVSVEDAPMAFLIPDHPLLNFPNTITAKDFDGWIQERGLNFPSQWDPKYDAVLSSHDPGESEKKGGLLYTRYGKGIFISTSLSWFRQLPEGVPGAYRLFANLISAGNAPAKPAEGKK